ADRDAPQPGRDVTLTPETPRLLPDRDERVLDRVGHQVPVVAPPGQPHRQPPRVPLVERAEGAHVLFGDAEQQRRVARAAVHTHTVARAGRKRFTPQTTFPVSRRSRLESAVAGLGRARTVPERADISGEECSPTVP